MSAHIPTLACDSEIEPIRRRDCRQCPFLDLEAVTCRGGEFGSPLRKCLMGLLREEFRKFPSGKTVLEIGCGSWPFVRDLVRNAGSEWVGVEPAAASAGGQGTIATFMGTAARVPLSDSSCDYVISCQALEHWHEFQTSFSQGIAESWRVLRPGGVLSLNFPLFFHGHPIFFNGNERAITSLLPSTFWDKQTLEIWRNLSDPLEPYIVNKGAEPARIAVLRARKRTAQKRLTPRRLWREYAKARQWPLINPLPALICRARRMLGATYLHGAPSDGMNDQGKHCARQ